jgi:Ca2+-binding EF-hand superfamily protein
MLRQATGPHHSFTEEELQKLI